MPHPAGAGRALADAVGGLQVGLRVSLERDSDEICSSMEWSLQEGVPRVESLQKHLSL